MTVDALTVASRQLERPHRRRLHSSTFPFLHKPSNNKQTYIQNDNDRRPPLNKKRSSLFFYRRPTFFVTSFGTLLAFSALNALNALNVLNVPDTQHKR